MSILLAPLTVTWRMFTTLSPDERVTWIVWVWGLVFLGRALRRYRPRPSQRA